MNKQVFALAVSTALSATSLAVFSLPAFAQTSVTLYGVLDEGINYTNNVGHGHVYELASGFAQGSRWGLKGAEELGGGLKAIFQLENGFDVSSGRLNQGGRMFGRQAFVGLSSEPYGTLTFGRQYDSVVDFLAQTTANGNWAGSLFSHPYDNDNTDNSFRLDNSVKYTSPSISGFQFGGVYSFSNDTGFANNRAYSFGGQYTYGGLLVAAAYLQADNPGNGSNGAITANDASFIAARMRVFGGGITYTFGPATAGFVYTNSNYLDPTGNGFLGVTPLVPPGVLLNSLKYQNFEVNGKYQISPILFVGAQYVYTIETYDASNGGVKPKIHSFGLMADYNLSKRTDVYIQGEYQQVTGDATFSILDDAFTPGTQSPSSTSKQVVVRAAIRHKF
ncbi:MULTISPECIES: porin [Paraburkholderia]|uniref:Porin n=1 Tax=Paraburkholderia madseniana TaxID=2599607 RepID=A0A6N6WC64_9BURK|nr:MULTISPECIES: porin [Paraburkholderia]KAE8758242.1 porin [Paraburkholderia madseniana]MCX4147372.1 porin [Paraburkholderia madseniana]MCX4172881.1 porin [Paraburkholderia madseniana]MDN7150315.1 porin [Paraburkholderia sp. WS6]MDQ6409195.1 porin [Paraburkholderia madseniana]